MLLRILSYNIRNGRGVDNKISLKSVAETIAATEPHLAGLQELDFLQVRSGLSAQACKLGKMLGMHQVFGPTIKKILVPRFGNAVLSRYPIIYRCNYPLSSWGEPRSLLKVKIIVKNIPVSFFTLHLGLNMVERLFQVDELLKITTMENTPLVITGDFNAIPEAVEMQKIKAVYPSADPQGLWPTFPTTNPKRKIDYIFFSEHWELNSLKVYFSPASDHLPLLAELRLPD